MPLLTLSAGRARLRLAPAIGGSIADWYLGTVPVMRPVQPGALEEGNAEWASKAQAADAKGASARSAGALNSGALGAGGGASGP
jgi:hypothetical protein